MFLVVLYICLYNLPFSGLPDRVLKSVLGHCHSSLGIKVPKEFVKSHPWPNSLLQSRIYSECEWLAASPGGRAQGWDVEGTEERGKKWFGELPLQPRVEVVSYPRRVCCESWEPEVKTAAASVPRVSFPTSFPRTLPGSPR